MSSNRIPLLSLDSVDSTMLEAERRIEAGMAPPFVVWARSQRGGVGRHGRQWSSPPGNLYWTLAAERDASWPRDFGLSFTAGLAVMDAIGSLGVAAARLQLKWPNDVLLDGGKVAGILIRATHVADRPEGSVIVGIGVNCASHPPATVFAATSLREAGIEAPLEALRDALTARFIARLDAWIAAGFAGLRAELERRLHGVGQPVRVALDGERTQIVEGVSAGLDERGGLRVVGADGATRSLTAGDVL